MLELDRKIAVGATWAIVSRLLGRCIGLVSTIILARLLVPADFGIVAMAIAVVGALELMTAFSFDVVLIQNRQAERRHYDTVWTFTAIFGFVVALALVVLAWPSARFYSEDRLVPVFYVLAIGSVLHGLQNVGIVDFRKELTFEREFAFQLGIRLTTFFITVPLAYILRSYWALVVGIVSGKLTGVVLSYYMHPYRPRLSLAAARELFSISSWLFINNLLHFVRYRASDFIIGRISGTHALGLYSIADEIAHLPSTELVAPINRALLPGFSKMSGAAGRLRDGFVRVAALVTMVALPVGLGLAAVCEYLIPLVLGSKWLGTIPLIMVLAIQGALVATQTSVGVVLLAAGRAKTITYMAGANVVVLIPALIYATNRWGPIGAAWTLLASICFMTPVNYGMLYRHVGVTVADVLKIYLRPSLAACTMYVITQSYVGQEAPSDTVLSLFVQLSTAVLLGAFTYAFSLLALWWVAACPEGPERTFLRLIEALFRRYIRSRSE